MIRPYSLDIYDASGRRLAARSAVEEPLDLALARVAWAVAGAAFYSKNRGERRAMPSV